MNTFLNATWYKIFRLWRCFFEMTDCLIRQAIPQDISGLISLLKVLFAIEADFAFDEENQRRGLELMMSTPDRSCIMVAEVNGKIIGMCTAQLLVTTAEGGLAALVEDMVVRQDYRKQGIGRSLLTKIEEWSCGHGAKRLELLADCHNTPALEFYKKLHWRHTQLICLHKK
jgi:GNAT superfamily N-acetyltransferase